MSLAHERNYMKQPTRPAMALNAVITAYRLPRLHG